MVRVHVPVVTLLTVLTLATPVAAGEPAAPLAPEGADLKAPSDDDGDARPPDPGSLSTMKAEVSSPDGVRISYEARGEGAPALVFVHGWSCDRTYWQAQLDRFSREHRVVAVDLAGHGESGLGREAWTMRAFGGDVAAVVDALGLERTVLIGHSMGGDVIVEAARRLPGRVDGLVWVDVYRQLGSGRTPEAVQTRLAPFRDDFEATTVEFVRGMFPPGTDASLVDSVAADMSAAPPAVALEALESAWNYSREVTVALEELKLPVVAINPDDGSTDLESLTRHGVRPVLMEGVGHFLMMEKPEAFNELLAEVIDDLGG